MVSQPQWELVKWVQNSGLAPICAKWPRARPPCFLEQLLLAQRQDGMGVGPRDRTGAQGFTKSVQRTPFVASASLPRVPVVTSHGHCHIESLWPSLHGCPTSHQIAGPHGWDKVWFTLESSGPNQDTQVLQESLLNKRRTWPASGASQTNSHPGSTRSLALSFSDPRVPHLENESKI